MLKVTGLLAKCFSVCYGLKQALAGRERNLTCSLLTGCRAQPPVREDWDWLSARHTSPLRLHKMAMVLVYKYNRASQKEPQRNTDTKAATDRKTKTVSHRSRITAWQWQGWGANPGLADCKTLLFAKCRLKAMSSCHHCHAAGLAPSSLALKLAPALTAGKAS